MKELDFSGSYSFFYLTIVFYVLYYSMTVKQAKIFINDHLQFIQSVERIPNRKKGEKRWLMRWLKESQTDKYNEYSDRELIKFVKIHRQNWFSGKMKKFSNGRNRARVRDLINKGDYSAIPQNKECYKEDIWNWD